MTTSYRTIQQSITAGNNYNGAAPSPAVLTRTNGIEVYTADNTGGLFDFAQDKPTPCKYFSFKGGGQSSWSLKLYDAADNELGTVASGTNEASKFEDLSAVILNKGDKLKLVSAGASTAMVARITVATR